MPKGIRSLSDICAVERCDGTHRALGYCERHYRRFVKYGDPLAGRTPVGEPLAHFMTYLTATSTSCKIWPYSTSRGYGCVKLFGRNELVHVLACSAFNGPMPHPGMYAAHGPCHTPACWHGPHLSWATPSENALDRRRDGTDFRGERQPRARLTRRDVDHIRSTAGAGQPGWQAQLARELGVSTSTICDIVKGRTWRLE